MKRLLLVVAAVMGMSIMLSATASATVNWPMTARCASHPRCIAKHMNQLHKQNVADRKRDNALRKVVQSIIDSTPPTNNVLQAQIDQLGQENNNQWDGINQINNRIGCWQTIAVTRNQTGVSGTAGKPFADFGVGGNFPSYGPDFDGYFDLRHAGQPDNSWIYRFLWDPCNSGPAQ